MAAKDENEIRIVTKVESFNNLSEKQEETGKIDLQPYLQKYLKTKSQIGKEFLAEVLGTFILVMVGLNGVAQFKFSSKDNPYAHSFLSVNIAFGFGAIMAILLVGKVSGAHLNPAVSLAMLLTGRLTFLKFFVYSLGQTIGAFLGAFITFITYLDALKNYRFGMYSLDSAGIFATYPNPTLSTFGGFFDQIIGTAVLVMVVLAITDKKNVEMPHGTTAILIGCLLIGIGTSLGYNCGYAINPARDFGPRLFTLVAGWGSQTFSAGNYFFWIPIIAPMIGSIVATLFYLTLVSIHL